MLTARSLIEHTFDHNGNCGRLYRESDRNIAPRSNEQKRQLPSMRSLRSRPRAATKTARSATRARRPLGRTRRYACSIRRKARRDEHDDRPGRALLVLGGWCAVLFGVLAAPLVALSYVDLPRFELFGDDGLNHEPTPPTLASVTPAQCRQLDALARAGGDAYATFGTRRYVSMDWPQARAEIDAVLARYEFVLQASRASLPRALSDDLRNAAGHVHEGRALLATSATPKAYVRGAIQEATAGFSALLDIEARLGDACGTDFSFVRLGPSA
jgi:hypothetical protein